RIEVEVAVQERLVDIVAEGFDAGVRESAAIERDMVQVRLTDPFRYVVVGASGYLARHGVPERPEDLLRHECITFRSQTTGALYAWELERGRKTWRVPGRGCVWGTLSMQLLVSLEESGGGGNRRHSGIPSPSSSSRAVPARTASSWQPDGNAPLSASRLSEAFQPIAWTATRMKHRNQEQRIVVHGVDQFDREGPEHHQRSP